MQKKIYKKFFSSIIAFFILFIAQTALASTLISRTVADTTFSAMGTYSYKGFYVLNTGSYADPKDLGIYPWATLASGTHYYVRVPTPSGITCSSLGLAFHYQYQYDFYASMGNPVSGTSSTGYCEFDFLTDTTHNSGRPRYNLVFPTFYDFSGKATDFTMVGDSSTSFRTHDILTGSFVGHGTPAFEMRDVPFSSDGTCSDGTKNQNETGIDSGGACTIIHLSPRTLFSASSLLLSTNYTTTNPGSSVGMAIQPTNTTTTYGSSNNGLINNLKISQSAPFYARTVAPIGTTCSDLTLRLLGSYNGLSTYGHSDAGILNGVYCDLTFGPNSVIGSTFTDLPANRSYVSSFNPLNFSTFLISSQTNKSFTLFGSTQNTGHTFDLWTGNNLAAGSPFFEVSDVPFDTGPIPCTIDCNSSVLFLPGITGSKLYEDIPANPNCSGINGICELKRWLPAPIWDFDVRRLYLDDTASSIYPIHTKDVLSQAFGLSNIYKSFLDSLDSWKNSEYIITDYSAIPYDWRFSASEVVARGKKDSLGKISYSETLGVNETPYILSELLRLADTSRTKKVTIVAHSNGGLVAKELMLKLRELGKEDLVDKLILVAVPGIGTPDALKSILHGDSIGWGFIADSKLTREFAHNMPTAYDLLPSRKYFEIGGIGTSIATFDDSTYFANTRTQYGSGISNFSEFQNYLKNLEGRATPSYGDLNHANTLNNALIDKSDALHNRLDAWEPTSATKVIEVAGWGEYTLGGINYKTERECTSYNTYFAIGGIRLIYSCLSYRDKQVLDITDTLEGDGTVVQQSAHYLSNKNTPNTEKWWVDLKKYSDDFFINRDHKDILEVSDLLNFIKSKINNSNLSFAYISQAKPTSSKTMTRIKLNSPLTLSLYDSAGNHTGLTSAGDIEENIPGSRYKTIGESKYILVPQDIATNLKLKGYQEGSFSLNIDTLEGDIVVSNTTFSAIPSSTSTIVTMDLPANTDITTSTPLKVDFNGDGTVDTQITPKPNGEVVYDTTPSELKVTFDLTSKDVLFSAIDILDQNPIITTTNTSTTLIDASNNTTVIPFTKYKESQTKLKFFYNKIIRNGIITMLPDTHIVYDWQEEKGLLTDLDIKVTIQGVEKYVFNYKKATDMTTIKIKTNTGMTTSTKSGFVRVTLITNLEDLNISY